jgi:beta-galactosidase
VTHPRFVLTVNRQTARFAIRSSAGALLAESDRLHVGRGFTEAEALRTKTAPDSIWTAGLTSDVSNVSADAVQTSAGVRIRIHAKYTRVPQFNQSFEGDQVLLVAPSGRIDVTYDYAGTNNHGMLLEAGSSLIVPATASEFRWIGDGPFPGYPGKDRLNEFGFYHLNRDDLNFQGNRRRLQIALLTNAAGEGILLSANDADVSVENYGQYTMLSHNAVISGRGNKGVGPETAINAEYVKKLAGSFTLLPLDSRWPAALKRWFGVPNEPAKAFRPFYRSYDQ